MLDKPREKDPFAHSSSDEEEDTGGDDMGTDGEAWAKQQLEAYIDWCKGDGARAVRRMQWDAVLNWWSMKGRILFPYMFTVFQSLLAVGAGAADMERDFSVAGQVVRPERSMLDAAIVEVTLFLHLNAHLIPPFSSIPRIPATGCYRLRCLPACGT